MDDGLGLASSDIGYGELEALVFYGQAVLKVHLCNTSKHRTFAGEQPLLGHIRRTLERSQKEAGGAALTALQAGYRVLSYAQEVSKLRLREAEMFAKLFEPLCKCSSAIGHI